MMDRKWGGGQSIGVIYILSEADNDRFGSHWFKGRIKDGDVVLCVAHTGDCFYDYKLIKVYGNGLEVLDDSPRMCGYGLGIESEGELTSREFHLLMAGEFVKMDDDRIAKLMRRKEVVNS
ncbi:MAG: hypothetical protein V3T31_08550 [candidate division Zixibacteria bacterium]